MSEYRKFNKGNDGNDCLADTFDVLAQPIVTVDVERYQSYLDEPGRSDEQKAEFIETLWALIVQFVDIGFGVHPLQEVCGKDSANCPLFPSEAFNQVSLDQSETEEKTIKSSQLDGLEVK